MKLNISNVHKILTLQGPLNDIVFLEHFYLISVLKSYLLTKKGEYLLSEFLEHYTSCFEEQFLIIHYLLEKESAFCLYFKEPLTTIENFVSLLEKKISNQNTLLKKEIFEIENKIKKYALLFQEEKQNESLYETMEMDNRSLVLNYPKSGLRTCFIVDTAVYQVLLRKHPFHQLEPLLKGEGLYYALGSVYKLLYDLQGNLTSREECTYHLQDFTYLENIIEEFFPYAQDDISESLVDLIKVLLENCTETYENKSEKEKGQILEFKRKLK